MRNVTTMSSSVPPGKQGVAFHIMTKPVGPICNLDCRYCFYLEKERLYQADRREHPSWQMPDDVLESYIKQYIGQQDVPEISFAWQGGEPTLLGVRFFRRVVELQEEYANGKRIINALQTNGMLLDDDWGEFLAQHGFLVGLSLDGPQELHDAYRVDKQGRPTFDHVMRGLGILKRHCVDYNLLTVVNRLNSQQPREVYRFLKEAGSGFLQFIPLVERLAPSPRAQRPELAQESDGVRLSFASPDEPGAPVTDWSVRSGDWGGFLVEIFEEWVRRDVGRVFVNLFDVALGIWAGEGSSLCVFREKCGTALAVEHNGDLYSCDHYVYPQYRLGNITQAPMRSLVFSENQVKFGSQKGDSLPKYCRKCEVRFACNGECPKHRFIRTPDGEPGLNYLCADYKRFFTHIDPYMRTMADLLRCSRAPAEIMALLAQREAVQAWRAAGRNDPCPCGSGRKYKQCCLQRRSGS